MEISFEPLAFLLASFDHPGARPPQLLEPRVQLGMQAAVFERDARGCSDRLEQLRLVVERSVVHQGSDAGPVQVDQRRGSRLVVGQGDGASFKVDVGAEVR